MSQGAGGSYPSSLDSLLDDNGHIPLEISQYSEYSEGELEPFFSNLPYESVRVYDPQGGLAFIASQYSPDSASYSLWSITSAVKDNGDGAGFKHVHNHPIDSDNVISIFSREDMHIFVDCAEDFASGRSRPNVFEVRTSEGAIFTLEYKGGGERNVHDFKAAYSRAFNSARTVTQAGYNAGLIDSWKERNNKVSDMTSDWLLNNAHLYGFEYNTNWDTVRGR